MKRRIGFVSNSSTYSYLTYIPEKKIDTIVFMGKYQEYEWEFEKIAEGFDQDEYKQEITYEEDEDGYTTFKLAIRDYGYVYDDEYSFRSFLEERYLEMGSLESEDKNSNDYQYCMHLLEEFKYMNKRGYVALEVMQSTETDELGHYVAMENVPFTGIGGTQMY